MKSINLIINIFIALVWLVNGLYCKILNAVPRHRQIVGEILGEEYATSLTTLIGIGEIFIAIWILTKILPEVNVWVQIALVVIMNILEFVLVPDLLLWGKLNLLFAMLFAALIFLNNYKIGKGKTT